MNLSSFSTMDIPNLKYKTTLCNNWLEETPCEKGSNCYFAHGQQQLRKIEENQQLISNRNMQLINYQYSTNYKTVYCKFYAKGQCKLGTSCTFAHKKKEKRKINKFSSYQQPPFIPYMQYSVPFFYPQFSNFGGQMYFGQDIQTSEKLLSVDQNQSQFYQYLCKNEAHSKSEEVKISLIEEGQMNKNWTENSQKQEENLKIQNQNSCPNLQ